jgi:hypothetical protein
MGAFGVVVRDSGHDRGKGLVVVVELVRTDGLFLQGEEHPLDKRVVIRVTPTRRQASTVPSPDAGDSQYRISRSGIRLCPRLPIDAGSQWSGVATTTRTHTFATGPVFRDR